MKYALCLPILIVSLSNADVVINSGYRQASIGGNAAGESYSDYIYWDTATDFFQGSMQDGVQSTPSDSSFATASYNSLNSSSEFFSQASISGSVQAADSPGAYAQVNVYSVNAVSFTLTEMTSFRIQGDMEASGRWGISRFAFVGDENIFSLAVSNQSISLDQTITLDPGDYSFSIRSNISLLIAEQGELFESSAAHDITVTVLPTPSTTASLLLIGFFTPRRRR